MAARRAVKTKALKAIIEVDRQAPTSGRAAALDVQAGMERATSQGMPILWFVDADEPRRSDVEPFGQTNLQKLLSCPRPMAIQRNCKTIAASGWPTGKISGRQV